MVIKAVWTSISSSCGALIVLYNSLVLSAILCSSVDLSRDYYRKNVQEMKMMKTFIRVNSYNITVHV